MQKRLTCNSASLTFGVQDPLQIVCIRRKQGYNPWSLSTESRVQILQGPHQVQTALVVLEQAPLIETLANKTALLLDLLAWVANCPFNHFPLLQEDLDFRVSPWANEWSCRDGGARWVLYRRSHTQYLSPCLGGSPCTLNWQKRSLSVIKTLGTLAGGPRIQLLPSS